MLPDGGIEVALSLASMLPDGGIEVALSLASMLPDGGIDKYYFLRHFTHFAESQANSGRNSQLFYNFAKLNKKRSNS
jgi:hypothetical protein